MFVATHLVLAAGGERRAVARVGDAGHRARVALQHAHALPGHAVPHPHLLGLRDSGVRVWVGSEAGSGSRLIDSGVEFRVQGLGFRVQCGVLGV